MVYDLTNGIVPVELANIRTDRVTVGLVTLDELEKHNDALAFSDAVIAQCRERDSLFRSTTQIYGDHLFSIVSALDISDVTKNRDRIGLLVKRNLMLLISVVDDDSSVERIFEDVVRAQPGCGAPSLERLIAVFFERLVKDDNGRLEALSIRIDRLEDQVEREATNTAFNAALLGFRRTLTTIRNYYDQFGDIADILHENGNGLFDEDQLHHFLNMSNRMARLSSNAQQLRDALVQVREAYQAEIDISANRIMKLFTVVTTVFLPLTLLVGWYGMNFTTMPEITWKYGYVMVIVVSVAIAVACIWIFKRKRFL